MKFIWKYAGKWRRFILGVMLVKLAGTGTELMIPYVLEHIIDKVAPVAESAWEIAAWGALMLILTILTRFLNMTANRMSVRVARESIYAMRRDLFHRALNLSGRQMDQIGLPSLISRMTSDSYNVQNFVRMIQTMGIRAPIMLLGGIVITMTMDTELASILAIMAPVMMGLVVFVSLKGIPLYEEVQRRMDKLVRIMRENISGIRVVKALSKEPWEIKRYGKANDDMARKEVKASVIMSLPGPLVTLFLNVGLTLVVWVGARRVHEGATEPGVILAFLTYFNMILMGVMGLNRIFMMMSKANASAKRIREVSETEHEPVPIPEETAPPPPSEGELIFDHVTFNYDAEEKNPDPPAGVDPSASDQFPGEKRQNCLENISFSVKKGGSLGIIGATGSGKTSIVNLLMRFYDPQEGHVFVGGKDVRTWETDELRRKFGVVFQNDVVFAESIRSNLTFGRQLTEEMLHKAAEDAMAADFIEQYEEGYDHEAAIHGANFSGGQKQRLLIARALAAHPEILILDDSSSALDYQTDAALRRAIREHHGGATTVVIAQRISSLRMMDEILVLHEGKIIGRGPHDELMRTCPVYQDICRTQMREEVD